MNHLSWKHYSSLGHQHSDLLQFSLKQLKTASQQPSILLDQQQSHFVLLIRVVHGTVSGGQSIQQSTGQYLV